MAGRLVELRVPPKLLGSSDRINVELLPPCRFIPPTMKNAMVSAAQGYRELVADPAAQCARLGKSQMMGVRRLASAQEAWLGGYEL